MNLVTMNTATIINTAPIHTTLRRAICFCVYIVFAGIVTGLPQSIAGEPVRINCVVSILPQKFFVNQIAGDTVNVMVLVQPGYNPVTYEPTPRQLVEFSAADIYFRIGVPFERLWLNKLINSNPELELVNLHDGIAYRRMENEDHHHGETQKVKHSDEMLDPHIWLSPSRVLQVAKSIRQTLIRYNPDAKAYYEANYQVFEGKIKNMDSEIRKLLVNLRNREFLVFHPSWGYFAEEYGLKQIAIEESGNSPGAKSMSGIIAFAREKNLKTIFVQKQFSSKVANTIAKSIGGKVVIVDPLAENYFESMKKFAIALSESNT